MGTRSEKCSTRSWRLCAPTTKIEPTLTVTRNDPPLDPCSLLPALHFFYYLQLLTNRRQMPIFPDRIHKQVLLPWPRLTHIASRAFTPRQGTILEPRCCRLNRTTGLPWTKQLTLSWATTKTVSFLPLTFAMLITASNNILNRFRPLAPFLWAMGNKLPVAFWVDGGGWGAKKVCSCVVCVGVYRGYSSSKSGQELLDRTRATSQTGPTSPIATSSTTSSFPFNAKWGSTPSNSFASPSTPVLSRSPSSLGPVSHLLLIFIVFFPGGSGTPSDPAYAFEFLMQNHHWSVSFCSWHRRMLCFRQYNWQTFCTSNSIGLLNPLDHLATYTTAGGSLHLSILVPFHCCLQDTSQTPRTFRWAPFRNGPRPPNSLSSLPNPR